MEIRLREEEVRVVLDALVEAMAFDNDADDIKDVYNKILEEVSIEGYKTLG